MLDASVIIDLSALKCLELAFGLADNVYIPQRLFNKELEQDVKSELNSLTCEVRPVTTSQGLLLFAELARTKKLSEYDRETIVLAKEVGACCATNDGKMRDACDRYGIEKTGTLGILGNAKDGGMISVTRLKELCVVYQGLPGCRLSVELIN